MAFLVRLALRNLWRNRRRTVLTFSALAVGIAWLILVDSLSGGLAAKSTETLVHFETGDLRIHAPGYWDEREELPLDPVLPARRVLQAVEGTEGVAGAAARVMAAARVNVGWEELPVVAVAVDPARDGDVFPLADYVEGRLPRPGAFEAVVGGELARLLDLGPGDPFTLVTRTRAEALEAFDLEVVGLAWTPHPAVNQLHVYFPLDVADARLALAGGATEVAVRAEAGRPPAAVQQSVRQALAAAAIESDVLTWQEAAADFLALMQTSTAGDFLLLLLILLIALVGVTNTILLGTLERRREIGIMKALGMREGEIVRLFLLEATGIALLAVAAGTVLGAAANLYLVRVGLDLEPLLGDMDFGYPVVGTLHGRWNPVIFLGATLAGVAASWAAAYLPARRAARLDPAATLRG